MSTRPKKIYQHVQPLNRLEWRRWLSKNHRQKESVWLVLPKKTSDLPYFSMSDAVEEALCYGWIDSLGNKHDEKRFKVLLSPRKPNSKWSSINKARVRKLIRQGLMRRAGLKAVERAKKQGTWSALDHIERLEYPPELRAAFRRNKAAEKKFQAFPASSKKAILHWLISARRPETLKKRIRETVNAASKNVRVNESLQKKS